MPYSFTQIEQDKSRTIGWVFTFLVLFYFGTALSLALVFKNFLIWEEQVPHQSLGFHFLNSRDLWLALGTAFILGGGHWWVSVVSVIPRIQRVLNAQPLDPDDQYHRVLANVIEEVSVATGGKKIAGLVIPSAALNAFALSDFEGNHVIGVTEGLLSRLTRSQVEAVVGHEAAHIVSGDCLSTTVTTALFELYNGMLNGVSLAMRGYGRGSGRRERSSATGFAGLLIVVYLLLLISRLVSYLFRMFISREREYRADAVAVRLTRDPLSLAQALYLISWKWRGAGLAGEDLEAIFIANPRFSYLDESEGWFQEIFSTHPPVEKRIKVLLEMARLDEASLEASLAGQMEKAKNPPPQAAPILPTSWLVNQDGQWQGPFNLQSLGQWASLKPDDWVKPVNGSVTRAFEQPEIAQVLSGKGKDVIQDNLCPRCRLPLNTVAYAGTQVLKCAHCAGVLTQSDQVQRIILREEIMLSESARRAAALLFEQPRTPPMPNLRTANLFDCPRCSHPKPKMIRMFYTLAFPVEVDKCLRCHSIWFDREELEILQCLVEKAQKNNKL